MFATLQYCPEEDEIVSRERSDKPPLPGQSNQHTACISCRDKKIKCTGEKTGCERCRARGIACQYNSAPMDSGKKKRRSNRMQTTKATSSTDNALEKSSAPVRQPFVEPQRPASSRRRDDQDSGSATLMTEDMMAISIPPTPPDNSWPSDLMLSHTDTLDSHNIGDIATPSQISVSNFTMNDLMVEDMLNFPLDLPPLEPDPLSASNRNGAQESRTGNHTFGDLEFDVLNGLQPIHTHNTPRCTSLSQPRLLETRPPDPNGSPTRSAGTRSNTYPTPRTDSGSTASQLCQCKDMALQVLENLQVQQKRGATHAIVQQLNFAKRLVNQCRTIVNCPTCIQVSSLMILVAVICENLIDVFEAVTSGWEKKNWQAEGKFELQRSTPTQGTSVASAKSTGGDDLFECYQIDTTEERSGLIGYLTLLQVNRLDEILTQLRKNAMASDWESHITILQPLYQRLKSMQKRLAD